MLRLRSLNHICLELWFHSTRVLVVSMVVSTWFVFVISHILSLSLLEKWKLIDLVMLATFLLFNYTHRSMVSEKYIGRLLMKAQFT